MDLGIWEGHTAIGQISSCSRRTGSECSKCKVEGIERRRQDFGGCSTFRCCSLVGREGTILVHMILIVQGPTNCIAS